MLYSVRHFDRAALFVEACQEFGLLDSSEETSILELSILMPEQNGDHYPLAFQAEGVLSLPVSVRVFVRPPVHEPYFVCMITRHRIELESPKNMKPGTLSASIENRGHWPWPSGSFGNSASPRDNLSLIWARITKFAPNMHPGILSAGIANRGHWPWPSS